MKNDPYFENHPILSSAVEAQIGDRVPGYENLVEEKRRSEATDTSRYAVSFGVVKTEEPFPGFDGGFDKIRASGGDDAKVVEESRVAGTAGGVESMLFDVNQNVNSEWGVSDFGDLKGEILCSESVGFGTAADNGVASIGIKDADEDDSDDSKGSGAAAAAAGDEYRLLKRGVTEDDFLTSNASTDVVAGVESVKVGFGFEVGDMVWGKVKSHPWWPGHIFDPLFASPQVRRARRHGHALVAFFGDSSYGWFEQAELIPYEPSHAEKSQQTNSKNFMKAVEESEDEVSRRAALGLSCRCRNPHNFRPTTVKGYLSVDVVDYEPGGIYSAGQIRKARDGFQPRAMLSFVKGLAVAPKDVESKNIDFVMNKSRSIAYRKAVFEEYDVPYAEAFGQQPVRPAKLSPSEIDQSARERTRGLLSGPQVFAEALGHRRSSVKGLKTKEPGKKDRYILKRRDEGSTSQGSASSLLSPACKVEPSVSATGDYVLQRTEQGVSASEGQTSNHRRNEVVASSIGMGGNAGCAGPRTDGDMTGKGLSTDVSWQYASSVSAGAQEPVGLGRGPDSAKKMKAAKHPEREGTSEIPDPGQKKKRKKVEAEARYADSHKQLLASSGAMAGASMQIAAAFSEESKLSLPRRDVETSSSPSVSVGQMPLGGIGENKVELPELLGDLKTLALNPFYGAEKNRPAIVRQVCLRFRSLVFLKSLTQVPELPEAHAVEPPTTAYGLPANTGSGAGGGEDIRSMPSSKPLKPLSRLDDPTRAGKKRIPSERLEGTVGKKLKKVGDTKPSSSEKRAVLKSPEMQRAEGRGKDTTAAPSQAPAIAQPAAPVQKASKVESLRRTQPPRRVEEPTYLVIKFPPGSSLPTSMELKARFARLGKMDPEGNRVFYKTTTCRVLFVYKEDAERARVYGESVFSNAKLYLKPVAGKGEDIANEPTPIQPPAPTAPPKSILKKPTGDEAAAPGVRGTRVRFNVGEDTSARVVQTMEYRNSNSSFQEATGPPPSSFATMELTSNQKVISASNQLLPPLLPRPAFSPPLPSSRAVHYQHVEASPRVNNNYNLTTAAGMAAQAPAADISQKMLSLLLRCNDVVTNVSSLLGYVPYHPL